MDASSDGAGATAWYGYADVKPLADRLVTMLRNEMGDRLVAVGLYGSVARGEARSDSDIDLFVVHQGSRVAARTDFARVVLTLEDDPATARLKASGIPVFAAAFFRAEETLPDTPWMLFDVAHHGIVLFDPHSVLEQKLASLRERLAELGSRRIELPDGSWYWDLKPDMRPGEIIGF